MKTNIPLTICFILVLASLLLPLLNGTETQQTSSKIELLSVLLIHKGPERKPISPLIWYSSEEGKRLANSSLTSNSFIHVEAERVNPSLLGFVFCEVEKVKDKYKKSQGVPFGTSEVTFFYASSNSLRFVLEKAAMKDVGSGLSDKLNKQTYFRTYLKRIGIDLLAEKSP